MGLGLRRGGILAACTAAAILIVSGAYLSTTDWWAARTAERSIREALQIARPTAGRLSGIPYSPYSETPLTSAELDRAALTVLTLPPDSATTLRLHAYLDIVSRRWDEASARLEALLATDPTDVEIRNDLGVVYLELGRGDPFYYAEAASEFEQASEHEAVEPLFNLVLAYRFLHLPREAQEAAARFTALALDEVWSEILDVSEDPTELEILKNALANDDMDVARSAAERSPDSVWSVLVSLISNPAEPNFDLSSLRAVVNTLDPSVDTTPSAILDPLSSPSRDDVLTIRREVLRAAATYVTNAEESLRILQELKRQVAGLTLEFDQLWVDLVFAEALIWTGNSADLFEARAILDSVIEQAEGLDLKWVAAYALTIYGSHPQLATSRVELIQRLEHAVRTYEAIGAVTDSVRPRLLLAATLFLEGSGRESFGHAVAALDLTDRDNHRQRYQLYSALSRNPIVRSSPLGLRYPAEAAREAKLSGLPPAEIDAYLTLAELQEAVGESELADQSLAQAEAVMRQLDSPVERDLVNRAFTLTKARLLANRQRTREAEELFVEGVTTLENDAVDVYYLQRYELGLGNLYRVDGRYPDASQHFARAVEAVEREDDQLGATGRLFFDQERREIYETAIAFELDHGDAEQAMYFAQRYRAKLIADSLGSREPKPVDFDSLELDALGTTRVLEYTVLIDRIVLWVLSSEGFAHRSISIDRNTFEANVNQFISLLSTPNETVELEALSRQLFETLIEPAQDLLDPSQPFAIVPDRVLHRLPFRALRDPEGRYLVETYLFTQALDLNSVLSAPPTRVAGGKLTAFGSPVSDIGIGRELALIEQILGDIQVVNGPGVTKTRFLDGARDASLFHYAGHAAFDGGNSRTSSILLDGIENGPNAVSASEIGAIRLAPDALVVLSSCDSSLGNSIGGIEYRGLTSAFLAAGAGSVVGSLWRVETNATAELMAMFYRNLAAGSSIAQALQQAQLALIEQYPHPYYWSGFTLQGGRSALSRFEF